MHHGVNDRFFARVKFVSRTYPAGQSDKSNIQLSNLQDNDHRCHEIYVVDFHGHDQLFLAERHACNEKLQNICFRDVW